MSRRSLDEVRWSCLRRYVGQRVNLFRAMHTEGVFLGDDRTALALRSNRYALTARVAHDAAFGYYYVRDCHWYCSDLSRVSDEEIPEAVRESLLRQFAALIS